MIGIRYAEAGDEDFWIRLDRHLPEGGFARKVRDRQAYILTADGVPAGILRYNLFWDNTPFCTMLYIDAPKRRMGYGRALMQHWEREMTDMGYTAAMTSTQVDEQAQHFYRKLGYRDAGGFVMELPGYEQPMEMILVKSLRG